MIRSSTGISKLSVSEEIDPGFGPDTEQRRVEFATKLEEEAYSISLNDATKLAKANLITALKLWRKKELIPLIEKITLREIMIIWLFFEISYLYRIWNHFEKDVVMKITEDKEVFNKFLKNVFSALSENISSDLLDIKIDVEKIELERKNLGGDLIFSLKLKNDYEVLKIYEFTYSKLAKSLRDKFFDIITGVRIDFESLQQILRLDIKKIKSEFILYISKAIQQSEDYNPEKEKLHVVSKIITCFDRELSEMFSKTDTSGEDKASKEAQEKVKSFYGIKE